MLSSDRLHADELVIDETLVGRLIARDAPDLVGRELRELPQTGSSNRLFRLGERNLVRLPRQSGGGVHIRTEAEIEQRFANQIAVSVPHAVALGRPGFGVPESWSITEWIDGQHPHVVPPMGTGSPMLAADLADIVASIRGIEVPGTVPYELRHYRGGTLAAFDPDVQQALALCANIPDLDIDLQHARNLWRDAITVEGRRKLPKPAWYHGDLVAENLLMADGRISAVLDLGNAGVGDPTVDLHGAWEILDEAGRAEFASRLDVDEATWLVGRAWAIGIALVTLPYYWQSMHGRRRDRLVMLEICLASTN